MAGSIAGSDSGMGGIEGTSWSGSSCDLLSGTGDFAWTVVSGKIGRAHV